MQLFEEAWRGIICPFQVKSKMHILGPIEREIDGCKIVREDIKFLNRNQKNLCGYIFSSPDFIAKETVLYLHGNGGSKMEALPLVNLMPNFKMNIVAFDFAGCGNSDTENLTYGLNQVFDIREMLQEIRKHIPVTHVKLWGRSMGSLCAIMFAELYPYDISGIVLDSPFRFLSDVIERIASRKVNAPSFLLSPFLYFVKQRAAKEVDYDIFSMDYLKIFERVNTNIPVLFVFSNFDFIVPASEVLQFYNCYKGPKDLCEIYRTHDEDRPEDLFKQGMTWITCSRRKHSESAAIARQLLLRQQAGEGKHKCC